MVESLAEQMVGGMVGRLVVSKAGTKVAYLADATAGQLVA